MSDGQIFTQIQFRRDTSTAWQTANPVLASAEMGIEIVEGGPNRFKIGDGQTAWNDLEYDGLQGPAGAGFPAGGLLGQVLIKASSSDHDAQWADPLVKSVDGETGDVDLSEKYESASAVANHSEDVETHGVPEGERLAHTLDLKTLSEAVHNATVSVDRADGGVQKLSITDDETLSISMNEGQSLTLMIQGGDEHAVSWPVMKWVGGGVPTLSGTHWIELLMVGGEIYAWDAGSSE